MKDLFPLMKAFSLYLTRTKSGEEPGEAAGKSEETIRFVVGSKEHEDRKHQQVFSIICEQVYNCKSFKNLRTCQGCSEVLSRTHIKALQSDEF